MSNAKRRGTATPRQKEINGRVYWTVRVATGRKPDGSLIRKDIYSDSLEELNKKKNAILAQVDAGTYVDPARLTVSAWMDQWMKEFHCDLSDSTRREYEGTIRRYIGPMLGARQLAKLSMMDCQRFINDLDVSPGTVRIIYSVLRSALETARKGRLIPVNPAADCVLLKPKEKERRALSLAQQRDFLNALEGEPLKAMFTVMLATGMRVGEARGLRWTSCNLSKGEIRIIEQLAQHRGPDTPDTFTPPKYNSKRTVCPPPAVIDLLKAHRADQNAQRRAAGQAWDSRFGLVFCRADGTPIPYTTIVASIGRIGKRIGLDDLTPHSLRHSFATVSNELGISPKTTSAALGHKRAEITLDRYTHNTLESQKTAAEKLQDVYQNLSPEQRA